MSLDCEVKDFKKRTDQELFGGMLGCYLDENKHPELDRSNFMNGTDKEQNIKDMHEIIEALKQNPAIIRHQTFKHKYPIETNYYASKVLKDFLNMGLDEFWCRHPETLEFLYRHRHWYFITVEMCVNHCRQDILDELFPKFNNYAYVRLYETETDIEDKFKMIQNTSESKKRKIEVDPELEILTDPKGIELYNKYITPLSEFARIRFYKVLEIDFMKYPHLVKYIESECKKDPKDTFECIICWDSIDAADIHVRTTDKNWFIDIENYKKLTYQTLGIKVAKKLNREFLLKYYKFVSTSPKDQQNRHLSLEVLDHMGILEVPRNMLETLNKHLIEGDLWCGYRPDLKSREAYWNKVYLELKQNKCRKIDVIVENRDLFQYFVRDSKAAIESKSPNSEMYLAIQKHPDILSMYICNDKKPQFEITSEDIRRLQTYNASIRLFRRLYAMGYREELQNLEYPRSIKTDNDIIFVTQVLQLKTGRYPIENAIGSYYSVSYSIMRLLKFIDFGGESDIHKNPTEGYQTGQNGYFEECAYMCKRHFEVFKYN